MNETEIKKMFEVTQQNQTGKGLEITPEEAEKFKNAFEDPEFCKLMAEYVAELQDPNNRAETESYISQLEGENKVPEGKELVRPSPGFVAKTKKIENQVESKLFINIVRSESIAAPTKKSTPQGQNWSLPYSLGPPHMEKDKGGEIVPAFDCCFHPDALLFGNRSKQFRDLLVSTAIAGIEEAFKRQRQQVTVKKEFHILKGVVYKSGQIPTMLIDVVGKNKWNESNQTNTPRDSSSLTSGAAPPTASSAAEAASTTSTLTSTPIADKVEKPTSVSVTPPTQTVPAIQKGFLNKASKATPAPQPPAATSVSHTSPPLPPPLVQVVSTNDDHPIREVKKSSAPTGPISPNYTMSERGVLNLGDFGDMGGKQVTSTRPAELVYRIDIPLVVKTSEVELDVGERDLKLQYSTIYDLHIRLPYPIFDKKGVAKFDKVKKQLLITLPVQPMAALPSPSSPSVVVETSSEQEDLQPQDQEQQRDETISSKPTQVLKTKETTKGHGRWVQGKQNEITTEESRKLAEEVRKKAKEAQQLAEETEKMSKSVQKSKAIDPTQPEDGRDQAPDLDKKSEFLPAAVFVGRKPGYVFKRGDSGLGYYLDPYQNTSSSLNASPLVTAVASTNTSSSTSPLSRALPPSFLEEAMASQSSQHSFVYEFRQTKEAMAVIIQVPGIIESTVDLHIDQKSFDIYFKAVSNAGVSSDDSARRLVEYSQGFDLFEEVQIDKCKYDVATQNLVVILQKLKPEYWIDKTPAKREVLISRPYRSSLSSEERKTMNTSTQRGGNGSGSGGGGGSGNAIEIPSPTELLAAMKFSTQGLLDLD